VESNIASDVGWVWRVGWAEVGRLKRGNSACHRCLKRNYAAHLGWSMWFHGGSGFDCWQIVWPDRAGIFPWEDGFDATFAGDQRDLTENGWAEAAAICQR